jgi:poly [ADP-ribose] polymerase
MKYCKLVNVSDKNNNKYYEMQENKDKTFTASWGRVGQDSRKKTYSVNEWYKIYNSKITKGYTDITEKIIIQEKIELTDFLNNDVKSLFDVLQSYTSSQINSNYLVASSNITERQLNAARQYLSDAYSYTSIEDKNAALLMLYKTLPRKMKNVNDYLYQNSSQFFQLYSDEKDLLDNLIVQTELSSQIKLSDLNLSIEICDDNDFKIINDLINSTQNCNRNKVKLKKAFKVSNIITEKYYNDHINNSKNKKKELVWHGSRTPNWLSILKNGLKIKPQGVVHSGSAYGVGCYGSTCLDKSLNYTGNYNDTFLAIQEFHVGNQYVYDGWYRNDTFNLSYSELRKREYDSTFVKPGNGLLNNEYIIYNEHQTTIKYLIWI